MYYRWTAVLGGNRLNDNRDKWGVGGAGGVSLLGRRVRNEDGGWRGEWQDKRISEESQIQTNLANKGD